MVIERQEKSNGYEKRKSDCKENRLCDCLCEIQKKTIQMQGDSESTGKGD